MQELLWYPKANFYLLKMELKSRPVVAGAAAGTLFVEGAELKVVGGAVDALFIEGAERTTRSKSFSPTPAPPTVSVGFIGL